MQAPLLASVQATLEPMVAQAALSPLLQQVPAYTGMDIIARIARAAKAGIRILFTLITPRGFDIDDLNTQYNS
jgi:hypothetical protein